MDEELKIETVDRYLLGKMTSDEEKEFERLIKVDQELNDLVNSQRRMIRGLEKYDERSSFFAMLDEIKSDPPSKNTANVVRLKGKRNMTSSHQPVIRRLPRILAYVASFALIVAALFFVFKPGSDLNQLVASNFSFHPDLLSEQLQASGATADIDQELFVVLQGGIKAYNQAEYGLAKMQFNAFKDRSRGRGYLAILNDFYLAQIALEEDDEQTALELLMPLKSEVGLPIEAAINWYLALAYLKDGDKRQARDVLQNLQSNETYGDKAKSILRSM